MSENDPVPFEEPTDESTSERVIREARARCAEAGFAESTTPLVDAWHVDHKGHDSTHVLVNWPQKLWVEMGADRIATVRFGDATIRQPLDEMRLMLLAALEWLDAREADLP